MTTNLRDGEKWFVYLVKCCDGSLYCGMSNDVRTRVQNHNKGRGAKYTKRRLPVHLVWVSPPVATKIHALRLEWRIKRFPKKLKLLLKMGRWPNLTESPFTSLKPHLTKHFPCLPLYSKPHPATAATLAVAPTAPRGTSFSLNPMRKPALSRSA